MEIEVSIGTDDDGFLRRECPSCQREFKWFHGETEGRPQNFLEPDNYFCPYCGQPASPDDFWTSAQVEYARAAAMGPISRGLEADIKTMFGRSAKYTPGSHPVPDDLHDPNDMMIVEPPCHPFEPIKIADEWTSSIHCLMCGEFFAV